ncbi:MAG: sodium:alanine symporter family protein [Gemmatimonadota bacterium]
MDLIQRLSELGNRYIVQLGIPMGDETIPFMVIVLLGVGFYLTVRLGFVQLRRLGHGFAVTSGKYDDPDDEGDVSHFQALTTALSATVGIGNIAGVAVAIHWGGPGALFWMWVTAFLGMATKYTEVTLAQKYRTMESQGSWAGTVSGGPMYYIERGLGPSWRWMALFFAFILGITAFLTGNAVQANTVADNMQAVFGVAPWVTGLVTSSLVALVILGGISRIGKVTGILAPLMAALYVLGALFIILTNLGQLFPTLGLIFREAFNPTAGVAGTGMGALLVTLMWGVRRGLFSNEAGQGSAPIAHAAAKTPEPVSEGVVALLEPFIDTIVICTMTGLVVIMTGVWNDRIPTEITLAGGDLSYRTEAESGRFVVTSVPAELSFSNGRHAADGPGATLLAWHEAPLEELFTDAERTSPFTGVVRPSEGLALAEDGTTYASLYALAAENGAPLTLEAFRRGFGGLAGLGQMIVVISVLMFAISTAISWSYYGDRCANYLFGAKAILPYKMAFVAMHFIGAVLPLTVVWDLGDIFLAIVIWPNLIALALLSGKVKEMTDSYFERKPYIQQAETHRSKAGRKP